MRIATDDWTPDADTDVKLYHSMNDDIVAPENSIRMHQWLTSKGVNAVLDTTSLTGRHTQSGQYFLLYVMSIDLMGW